MSTKPDQGASAPSLPHEPPRVGEVSVVSRITRFSDLRGVERALLPSVRRRRTLPMTLLGSNLLARLQRLVELARSGSELSPEARAATQLQLVEIDAALERFADQLHHLVEQTPVMQLRATLPAVMTRGRNDVVSLLDLHLERCLPSEAGEPPHRVDFLITLLAQQRTRGATMLRLDPAEVSPGVARRCAETPSDPELRAAGFAQEFRDASIELLGLDDLSEMIERMRGVKARLGRLFFDREVLRAMVAYNIAAENRFRALLELEDETDAALGRTLHALQQLDAASLARTGAEPRRDDKLLRSPGARALEEALRERLAAEHLHLAEPGDPDVRAPLQADDALTCAALVVGLALRELPTLAERLGPLAIEFPHVKMDWVRELNEALRSAIHTLTLAGRSEQASHLTRTRMKYLSGS